MQHPPNDDKLRQEQIRAFWQRFEAFTRQECIPDHQVPYYLRWAQSFVEFLAGLPLRQAKAQHVAAYLNNLRASPKLQDWQINQASDAVRILLRDAAAVSWAKHWPWQTSEEPPGALPDPDGQPRPYSPRSAYKDHARQGEVEARFPELFDRLRTTIRTRQYSPRTEETYVEWNRRFLKFHDLQPPDVLDGESIRQYMEFLATVRNVSPSTQNLALNAVVFLFKRVLKTPIEHIGSFPRAAKRPKRMPTVLSREQIDDLAENLSPPFSLIALLMYSSGLRLMETVRLRVQDLDFSRSQIFVRSGKGNKDRITVLAPELHSSLNEHLATVRSIHEADLKQGFGEAEPQARARDFSDTTSREWRLQYVFPSSRLSVDPHTGKVRRRHVHHNAVQKAVKQAARRADIPKNVTCHCLRHSFATHMIEQHHNVRKVQELLGHHDLNSTMIYVHTAKDTRLHPDDLDEF